MGLRDLFQEINSVFQYLQDVWAALPNVIQLLIYVSFGVVLLIAVFKSIWG